jgi:hypothetical protein
VLQEALNAVTDAVERLARLEAALVEIVADSGGSRPGIRNDLARQSDLISLGVPG